MAISLAAIQKTKHASPPRIVLHGPEKVGKSTFFAGGTINGVTHPSAPAPIFIRTEDGLNGIDTDAFPLAEDYDQVRDALIALSSEKHDYKTVVIDSADWLERLIHEKVCSDENVANIVRAAGGYGNGYILAMNYWKDILTGLEYLNKQKGMVVGIICHSTVTTINDPQHEPYDVATLKLHSPKKGNGAADLFKEWADVIGYASKQIFVNKSESSGAVRAVDAGQQCNQLLLANNPACVSGNRYGLASTIPLNWESFEAEMIKANQVTEQAKAA